MSEEFDPSEIYSIDNKDDNVFADHECTLDYEDEVSREELENSMQKQQEIYEKHLRQMKDIQEKYQKKAEEVTALKNEKRGFFELNLNKSNLKGNTIAERLGYDAEAKNRPYSENHKVETWIDTHISNPKLRMAIYIGFVIICLLAIIIPMVIK